MDLRSRDQFSANTGSFHEVVDKLLRPSGMAATSANLTCPPIEEQISRQFSLGDDTVVHMNFSYYQDLKEWPTWEIALKVACYVVSILLAIFGNILVIAIVVRNKRMRNTTNYYLVNLAAADLAIASLCMWTHVANDLTNGYPLGQWFCKANPFSQSKLNVHFLNIWLFV